MPSASQIAGSAGGPGSIAIRAALTEAMARLRAARVPSHALAAELLLMHTLGCDRTWIYSHPEAQLEPEAALSYFARIALRAAGEPVQYLTGKQEFWGLEFEVTPDVLIPRPETEHVVEVVLERLASRRGGGGLKPLRVADVGTGSGCLAVALARELPQAEIFATDISPAALAVAKRNAQRHKVEGRVWFVASHLLEAFLPASGTFELIVSNPPYIGQQEARTLPPEVREHEPHAALFGGTTGSELYGPLLRQARALLGVRGLLALELGYNCLDPVLQIIGKQPGWSEPSVTSDLAGLPRVLTLERDRP